VLLEPTHQKRLIKNLIHYVEEFQLDGLDIDIEGALLTSIDKAGHYTPFIQALSAELKPRNKLLTCATASYEGGMVPVSSLPYFDFVNLMSYDTIGPSWGTPGVEHSSYDHAATHLRCGKRAVYRKRNWFWVCLFMAMDSAPFDLTTLTRISSPNLVWTPLNSMLLAKPVPAAATLPTTANPPCARKHAWPCKRAWG
jgi:hypothetical protein